MNFCDELIHGRLYLIDFVEFLDFSSGITRNYGDTLRNP